jgi:5-methylcytosine-specific restriction endonuclease McrA
MDGETASSLFTGTICLLIILIIFIKIKIQECFQKIIKEKEYKHRLATDPVFKLQEEYKDYIYSILHYENPVWLDSKFSEERIQLLPLTLNSERPLFDGNINDPLFQKLIEVKKTLGQELHRCRECGKITWGYYKLDYEIPKIRQLWDGFCSEKCKERCLGRDLEHYGRITNSYLNSMTYKYKKNIIKKLSTNNTEYDTIPIYEFSKKQHFLCAICDGKMNHIWKDNDNNYLYHSIDHIFPISKGGEHRSNNIQIAHIICNMVKGTGNNIKLPINAKTFLEKNFELANSEEKLIFEYKKYIKRQNGT